MLDRVGEVGDQRRGLRVDLAALQAEAAVDAVGPVAEDPVGDGHRADPHLDPGRERAAPQHLGRGGERVRRVRVAVRIAPRPVLAGDRQLALDRLVVRPQLGVGDRPVGADPVLARDPEVGGVEAGRVPGVVDHRAADAAPRVVLAEGHRVAAADQPLLGPVQVVRARLVADPVAVGIPERPGLEHDDPEPAAGQPLGQHGPARAAADDREVDLVVVPVAAHAIAVRHASPGRIEQERRVVAGRTQRALEQEPAQPPPLSSSRGSPAGPSSKAS